MLEGHANFSYDHPKGPIYGWFSKRGLRWLVLPTPETEGRRIKVLHSAWNDARAWDLFHAMGRYFSGMQEEFADVKLDLEDATPFQTEVWKASRAVGWGATASYGELTERLGKSKGSARAVGRALGANPLPIVVPCHRFLAANGDLVNYAFGLDWKRELLRTEGSLIT